MENMSPGSIHSGEWFAIPASFPTTLQQKIRYVVTNAAVATWNITRLDVNVVVQNVALGNKVTHKIFFQHSRVATASIVT